MPSPSTKHEAAGETRSVSGVYEVGKKLGEMGNAKIKETPERLAFEEFQNIRQQLVVARAAGATEDLARCEKRAASLLQQDVGDTPMIDVLIDEGRASVQRFVATCWDHPEEANLWIKNEFLPRQLREERVLPTLDDLREEYLRRVEMSRLRGLADQSYTPADFVRELRGELSQEARLSSLQEHYSPHGTWAYAPQFRKARQEYLESMFEILQDMKPDGRFLRSRRSDVEALRSRHKFLLETVKQVAAPSMLREIRGRDKRAERFFRQLLQHEQGRVTKALVTEAADMLAIERRVQALNDYQSEVPDVQHKMIGVRAATALIEDEREQRREREGWARNTAAQIVKCLQAKDRLEPLDAQAPVSDGYAFSARRRLAEERLVASRRQIDELLAWLDKGTSATQAAYTDESGRWQAPVSSRQYDLARWQREVAAYLYKQVSGG